MLSSVGQTLKVSKVFTVREKSPGLLWSLSKISRAYSNLHLNLDGFVNQASFLAPEAQQELKTSLVWKEMKQLI